MVVAEAEDGDQAITMCRTLHPDLLLLDVRLPKKEGLMVAHLVRSHLVGLHILMLSAFPDAALVHAAFNAGANGYVLKSVSGPDLLQAIGRVMSGEQVLVGVDEILERAQPSLSARELVVLQQVAEGLSTKEIAQSLDCSPRTIETYLSRVFQKLDATTRTQAVTIARRAHLLPGV